jgi:spore germination protein GerM
MAAAVFPSCGGRERATPAQAAASAAPAAATGTPADNATAPAQAEPLAKASVTLYFPSAKDDTLTVETREIVDTKRPADRGAQILAALLSGPQTDAALPAFPAGTTLRRLWVEDDGNAYADFSEELASGSTGGSADEILTVFSIVDSLAQNVSEIRRVGILVAGRQRDTLGHLDLRRPLAADLSLAQTKAAE